MNHSWPGQAGDVAIRNGWTRDEASRGAPVMQLSRVRFTIRRMIVAVAVMALGLFAYPFLDELFSDDGPFNATRQGAKSWGCGPASSVTVDIFEGSIRVLPST